MKIKAQIAMVLNLDKCIGCHTCSVTCKNTWTNRPGAEYVWFNNVETKPGVGYPKRWEDQEQYKGGWVRNNKGKLQLKSGSRWSKIALGKIFYNPDMPVIKDYYEPWFYNYEHLTTAKQGQHSPVAKHIQLFQVISWIYNGVLTGKMILQVHMLLDQKILIFNELKKISSFNLMKHL